MTDGEALLKAIQANPDCQTARVVYADWLDENDRPIEAAIYRGKLDVYEEEFEHARIAQDDTGGYDPSGYVACAFKRGSVVVGALVQFSHCSCYGTWTAINDSATKQVRWDWIGTADELVEMARREADPVIPSRTIVDDDYNSWHLRAVYRQVLEWDGKGRAVKEPPPKMGCGSRAARGNYCECAVCIKVSTD